MSYIIEEKGQTVEVDAETFIALKLSNAQAQLRVAERLVENGHYFLADLFCGNAEVSLRGLRGCLANEKLKEHQ